MNTRLLNIDSIFRSNLLSSSSSSFQITMPDTISGVVEMQVEDVGIPSTFYNISDELGNSSLVVQINNRNYTLKVANGLYRNKEALCNGVKDALTDICGSINCEISQITHLVTFTFSESFSIILENNEDPAVCTSLAWMLGFRDAVTPSTNINMVQTVTSTAACHIPLLRYLYVTVEDFHNENRSMIAPFDGSLLDRNSIARVRPDDSCFDKLKIVSSIRHYSTPVRINKLRLGIVDQLGRLINLNGAEWSVVLSLKCIE